MIGFVILTLQISFFCHKYPHCLVFSHSKTESTDFIWVGLCTTTKIHKCTSDACCLKEMETKQGKPCTYTVNIHEYSIMNTLADEIVTVINCQMRQYAWKFIDDRPTCRDCNPGPIFWIPGFGIGGFLIPGSRWDYGKNRYFGPILLNLHFLSQRHRPMQCI